ncbi:MULTISPECIES: GtrA family protein [unclassified Pseudomonas]|uniref:GtrA family protein n=1 Tax=unclassified Pseudomonas TaxID=196821 RepID=UPI0024477755|nr:MULTISPECIES: GtrA family protein [unclassified Pseudomonas]MDH0303027.1 GtrA family protein [Pseudomonas sp. GD04091]MDH1986346.1 GtrA family protein [Pseudomonas sp. GD03689]
MSLSRFIRYGLVGIGNTLAHWLVFLGLHLGLGLRQAGSNLLGFAVAASLSYYMNAHFTFAVRPSRRRYLLFLAGMGCLSVAIGALSDHAHLSPWLTLVTFSLVSLVLGYAYSHTVVFRRRNP